MSSRYCESLVDVARVSFDAEHGVCVGGLLQEESAAVLMAPDLHKGSVLDAIKDDVSPVHAMTQVPKLTLHSGVRVFVCLCWGDDGVLLPMLQHSTYTCDSLNVNDSSTVTCHLPCASMRSLRARL